MAPPLSVIRDRGRPRFWMACERPWAGLSGSSPKTLALHVAQQRWIGRQRAQGRLSPGELLEVVVVQLHGPGGMVVVLALDGLAQERREAGLGADVVANSVAQSANGIARGRAGP